MDTTTPTTTIGQSTNRDCSWCHKNARHLRTENGWYCCRCSETTPIPQEPADAALTDEELAMLDLEASWFKYGAVKETVIRERFDISSTQYYNRLLTLIERPEALAAAPMVVRRLQKLRDQRREQRSARRLGS